MNKDINKYYDTLNLMIPIRYQYIKKIIFKYQNKEIVNAFKSKKVLDQDGNWGISKEFL